MPNSYAGVDDKGIISSSGHGFAVANGSEAVVPCSFSSLALLSS